MLSGEDPARAPDPAGVGTLRKGRSSRSNVGSTLLATRRRAASHNSVFCSRRLLHDVSSSVGGSNIRNSTNCTWSLIGRSPLFSTRMAYLLNKEARFEISPTSYELSRLHALDM